MEKKTEIIKLDNEEGNKIQDSDKIRTEVEKYHQEVTNRNLGGK